MNDDQLVTTTKKALSINQDKQRYGTFAEIGAGQEVARHFFQAGLASHTVAKTMSAYDMTFSDAIYGKGQRYVSEARLQKMLEHEYQLLHERLSEKRGSETCFFVFADTVATNNYDSQHHCHGWMGVRFQMTPNGPFNDVLLHVKMKDNSRLQQQEALGILGVNLIFSALYLNQFESDFVASLIENIGTERVEIDIVRFRGPDLEQVDNRIISLELLTQNITNVILFNPDGNIVQPSDCLYGQPILIQRGTFRPVTNVNIEIIKRGQDQFTEDFGDEKAPFVIMELSTHAVKGQERKNFSDFLDRVEILTALGQFVAISNIQLFYELKTYLRSFTSNQISMVIGASHLEKLFDESYYKEIQGGILSAFGQLFDERTRLYVFPYKSELLCTTAQTFHPTQSLDDLYKYLYSNKCISDISNCDNIDTSIHSEKVRKMLEENDPEWKSLVPDIAIDIIETKKLFGYGK